MGGGYSPLEIYGDHVVNTTTGKSFPVEMVIATDENECIAFRPFVGADKCFCRWF